MITLKDPLLMDDVAAAFSALEVSPVRALKDPVAVLRHVAAVSRRRGQRFLDTVLAPGASVSLSGLSDDAASLYVSVVFVHLVDRLRRQSRARSVARQAEPVGEP